MEDGGGEKMSMGWSHMTFYQGKNSEILFNKWPGRNNGGPYALALVLVFAMGILVEFVASRAAKSLGGKTAIYAPRILLSYLIMLALMSFNVGVFLVAFCGQLLGFFLFRSKTTVNDAACIC